MSILSAFLLEFFILIPDIHIISEKEEISSVKNYIFDENINRLKFEKINA